MADGRLQGQILAFTCWTTGAPRRASGLLVDILTEMAEIVQFRQLVHHHAFDADVVMGDERRRVEEVRLPHVIRLREFARGDIGRHSWQPLEFDQFGHAADEFTDRLWVTRLHRRAQCSAGEKTPAGETCAGHRIDLSPGEGE